RPGNLLKLSDRSSLLLIGQSVKPSNHPILDSFRLRPWFGLVCVGTLVSIRALPSTVNPNGSGARLKEGPLPFPYQSGKGVSSWFEPDVVEITSRTGSKAPSCLLLFVRLPRWNDILIHLKFG
ncbi:uncharacterized protein BO96DRAFT_351593, partial [Aspergillus niger CBS 101883]|uniref:uncharacterized protein n=1 Tax=Aspergillus lacticoffeatus (strain CBS 101883) TaxID=1450533 RepID=UPI000D7EE68E